MSRENVEVVRLGLAAWDGSADFETALHTFHEDVVTRRLPPLPDARTAKGREGLLDVIAEWLEDFDDFELWVEECIDAGDEVVVRVGERARGGSSGVPVEARFWLVYELRDGKVVRLDMYATEAQALEAVGLSETACAPRQAESERSASASQR